MYSVNSARKPAAHLVLLARGSVLTVAGGSAIEKVVAALRVADYEGDVSGGFERLVRGGSGATFTSAGGSPRRDTISCADDMRVRVRVCVCVCVCVCLRVQQEQSKAHALY